MIDDISQYYGLTEIDGLTFVPECVINPVTGISRKSLGGVRGIRSRVRVPYQHFGQHYLSRTLKTTNI